MLESDRIPFSWFALDEEIANVAGAMGGSKIVGIGDWCLGRTKGEIHLSSSSTRKKEEEEWINGKPISRD